MINTQLDDGFENVLRMIRFVGETMLRPAGLAADRRGTPIPVDDPMFIQWNQTGLSFGAVGTGKNSTRRSACIPRKLLTRSRLRAKQMTLSNASNQTLFLPPFGTSWTAS